MIIAIVGPTAVGKSELSMILASKLDGEIVSIDSMQIYRGLDIGTAKPGPQERGETPHHMIDIIDPSESYSVAKFQVAARESIGDIIERGKTPILAGGSGLHLRAVVDDLRFPPGELSSCEREKLSSTEETTLLFNRLHELDPDAASKIHPNNRTRIIRALEAALISGKFSQEETDWAAYSSIYEDIFFFGLTMEREELYEKIEVRVDEMFQKGLIDEVRLLLESGRLSSKTALQAIAYKEMAAHIRGELDLDQAKELIKKRTRNFAKRQYTWFKRDPRIKWLHRKDADLSKIAETIIEDLRNKEASFE